MSRTKRGGDGSRRGDEAAAQAAKAPRGYGRRTILVNGAIAALTLLLPLASAASAAPVRILMLGDSITAGFGLPPEEALPVRLQARLKADGVAATVVNGGVSGDTTAGGRARLAWALGDKPNYVLVALGANDALRGLDPGEAYANLDAILAQLAAARVKALLVGMRAPANWGREYETAFDAIYPRLATKWHVPLYPFLLAGVALDPKLNQDDGLHPNPAGVAVIVAHLAPAVERLIGAGAAAG
jgi:acyl-CoA thioesterase-1